MAGGFPRVRLRFFASVSDPYLVQSPDDLRPSDPFRLAPFRLGLSPIIDQEVISFSCEKQISVLTIFRFPGCPAGHC
jgi:hypothetical protein